MCEIISISCSMTPSQPAPWDRPFIPFPIHLVSGHYTVTGPRRTVVRAKRIKVPEISIEFHLIHSKFQRVGDLQTKLRAERAGQRRHCPSISAGNAFSYFSSFFVLPGCCCCCCLECCRRDGAILWSREKDGGNEWMDETGWRIGDAMHPQWEKRQTGRWNEMGAVPSTHICDDKEKSSCPGKQMRA